MMIFRKIYNRWRWRHVRKWVRKSRRLSYEEYKEIVEELFPSNEPPFIELTKKLNAPGKIVPVPSFKFFDSAEESNWIKLLKMIKEMDLASESDPVFKFLKKENNDPTT